MTDTTEANPRAVSGGNLPPIELPEDAKNFLSLMPDAKPEDILTDPAKFAEFMKLIEQQVAEHKTDLSTDASRKRTISFAMLATRTKTFLDATGKELNEEARKQINAVDERRRDMRDKLDEVAASIRKPVDEWEAKESARTKRVTDGFTFLRAIGNVQFGETADQIKERLTQAAALDISLDDYRDDHAGALDMQRDVVANLTEMERRARQDEANRAELAQMRAEQEERDRKDAEAKAEQDRRDAEAKAEQERKDREAKAEEERVEREKAAQAERERKAEADRLDYVERMIEHIKQCGLGLIDGKRYPWPILIRELEEKIEVDADIFRDRAVEVEKLRASTLAAAIDAFAQQQKADTERAEQEARAVALRDAQAKAAEEEAARVKREANRKHASKIMGAAKEALMEHAGLVEDVAKAVVTAIKDGKITNVTINF